MTEFYTVKSIDNSRLVQPVAPNRVREMVRVVALGALAVAGTLLYAWQHFARIQLSYQLEALKAELVETAEMNQQLKLEVAGLRAPSRIDEIAQNQLGLTVPAAGQIASFGSPTESVLAELRGPVALELSAGARPRRGIEIQ